MTNYSICWVCLEQQNNIVTERQQCKATRLADPNQPWWIQSLFCFRVLTACNAAWNSKLLSNRKNCGSPLHYKHYAVNYSFGPLFNRGENWNVVNTWNSRHSSVAVHELNRSHGETAVSPWCKYFTRQPKKDTNTQVNHLVLCHKYEQAN